MNWGDIPIPSEEHELDQGNVEIYIDRVSENNSERSSLNELFKVTKYVSFDKIVNNLTNVKDTFNTNLKGDYIACLFTIDWISAEYKSNYWIYRILIKLGLIPPKYIVFNFEGLTEALESGINNFVFFDDASFSGYQLFDTIYSTFLDYMVDNNLINDNSMVNIYILLSHVSRRALNIFNLMLPDDSKPKGYLRLNVPMEELPLRSSSEKTEHRNDILKKYCKMKMIYSEYMQNMEELMLKENINTLEKMGINTNRIPIYFVHKMPDYISVPSEIYIGFTLKQPYDIIPLIKNCEKYYNKSILKGIETQEDIFDVTRDAPCPVSPYR